ncbi:Ribonuclease Z/BN like protein [Aduncisulcus paluster]|uniref:Ribonuclease Z/BN like protein n=1 Tax=Aduncisulcus paluster TaxID=2918883 RepID=A0ABQ5JYW1_9EUKA|nr:Ribonuclease Z/BN like protein [Aduncisulcus paluster]
MELTFLGTSGGTHSSDRICSSIAVNIGHSTLLFDCGPGTGKRLSDCHMNWSNIKYIFISHLHLDHVYGIIPILWDLAWCYSSSAVITIVGPKGIKEFIEFMKKMVHMPPPKYTLVYVELEEGQRDVVVQHEDTKKKGGFSVEAIPLVHEPHSHGFIIRNTTRKVDYEKFTQSIFPNKLIPKILTQSELKFDISNDDTGEIISHSCLCSDFIIEKSETLAILGDTKTPSEATIKALEGCDLVVMECTFSQQHEHLAEKFNHLGPKHVSYIIEKARLNQVVLTHFSRRYTSTERRRAFLKYKPEIFSQYSPPVSSSPSDSSPATTKKDSVPSVPTSEKKPQYISNVLYLIDQVKEGISHSCEIDCAFDGMHMQRSKIDGLRKYTVTNQDYRPKISKRSSLVIKKATKDQE